LIKIITNFFLQISSIFCLPPSSPYSVVSSSWDSTVRLWALDELGPAPFGFLFISNLSSSLFLFLSKANENAPHHRKVRSSSNDAMRLIKRFDDLYFFLFHLFFSFFFSDNLVMVFTPSVLNVILPHKFKFLLKCNLIYKFKHTHHHHHPHHHHRHHRHHHLGLLRPLRLKFKWECFKNSRMLSQQEAKKIRRSEKQNKKVSPQVIMFFKFHLFCNYSKLFRVDLNKQLQHCFLI